MIKILISGSNGIIGYELLNILKKKYYVIAIDSQPIGSSKSQANEFYKCPKGNTKAFIKFISKIYSKVDLMREVSQSHSQLQLNLIFLF